MVRVVEVNGYIIKYGANLIRADLSDTNLSDAKLTCAYWVINQQ